MHDFGTRLVYAGSNHNLSGWAWSENIGWISFNSSSCDANNNGKSDGGPGCPPKNDPVASYGVNIASGGALSGYAWSEHIGWISFNPGDTSGCPAAPCSPAINRSAGQLEGWAKALAADRNGWDGWIRLSGAGYGVTASGCNYDGYAWGSDVVGWIHFRGTNYGVVGFDNACADITASNQQPALSEPETCGGGVTPQNTGCPPAAFGESPAGACALPLRPTLSWDYSDADGDPQAEYELEVHDKSNFSSLIFTSGRNASQTNSYTLPAESSLEYKKTYFWRVRVWDERGAASAWSSGPSFTIQSHAAPSVAYSWTPFRPNKNEPTDFTDQSRVSESSIASWTWKFPDGIPADSIQQNPSVRFNPVGPKNTSLIVRDSDSLSCGLIQEVGVEWPTDPTFREIVPK